ASEAHTKDLLYAADMRFAADHLERGDAGQARQLLERHVPAPGAPDRRCFIWRYLHSRVHHDASHEKRFPATIYCQAAAANGAVRVAGESLGTVHVFNLNSREEKQTIATMHEEINGIAIRADGL